MMGNFPLGGIAKVKIGMVGEIDDRGFICFRQIIYHQCIVII